MRTRCQPLCISQASPVLREFLRSPSIRTIPDDSVSSPGDIPDEYGIYEATNLCRNSPRSSPMRVPLSALDRFLRQRHFVLHESHTGDAGRFTHTQHSSGISFSFYILSLLNCQRCEGVATRHLSRLRLSFALSSLVYWLKLLFNELQS